MLDSVQLFKALADQTRLRVLNLLTRRELCVCQIVEVLGTGQSKVSRHLAHLKNAGLVNSRREGLWIHYSLAPAEGALHEQVIGWLRHAKDEVPMAAADLEVLSTLGECADVCSKDPLSEEHGRRDDVAAVRS